MKNQHFYLISLRIILIKGLNQPNIFFRYKPDWLYFKIKENIFTYFQAFVGLTNLTSLSLRGNILTSLDPLQFTGLQNLVELDISGNRLFSITPEAFEGLNRLETLRLDFNRLTAIPLEALIRLPGKSRLVALNQDAMKRS